MNFIWAYEFFKVYPKEAAHAEFKRLNALLDEATTRVDFLERESHRLSLELRAKEEREQKLHRLVSVSLGDPSPEDTKERAAYVSRINAVADLLRPKTMHIIAQTREQLDQLFVATPAGWTREQYDNFLRGTSNFGKLFLDWLDSVESEHAAYTNPEPNE